MNVTSGIERGGRYGLNRAFSADTFWNFHNPRGVAPGSGLNDAPLALNKPHKRLEVHRSAKGAFDAPQRATGSTISTMVPKKLAPTARFHH
jgi:hypothetical protein